MELKKFFKMGGFVGVAIFLLILALTNCYTVDTGEVAIISTFGKITKVENEGLHVKIPFVQGKTFMETREKTYIFGRTDEMDTTMEVSTKDMQSIKLEFTVQASIIDPEKLYRAFNNKHEQRFIRPRVKEIIQATIAKYTIEEFVSKRAEISRLIFEDLKDDFSQYGLSVSNVSIVNHDFSDEYEKAFADATKNVDAATKDMMQKSFEQTKEALQNLPADQRDATCKTSLDALKGNAPAASPEDKAEEAKEAAEDAKEAAADAKEEAKDAAEAAKEEAK